MSILTTIRSTKGNKLPGILRIFLGIMFLMTGLMKLFVPMLGEAFSGQLIAAGIPFYELNVIAVPLIETAVGLLLLFGLFSRVASLIVIGIMLVATYVHLLVENHDLFPLQPNEPIIPIIAIVIAIYILLRGGGAWSLDLKASK